MDKGKIFLVEDNENLGFTIADGLRHAGYAVELIRDGLTAAARFDPLAFDLCLVDVMLPKMDGFSLVELIREKAPHIPVLFLTARSLEEDKLRGFELGGDDYVTKPFSMKELLCRIEVFLKRSHSHDKTRDTEIQLGSYTFYFDQLILVHAKETRTLTAREAEVLHYLWQKRGVVIKREDILHQVWGDDDYFMGRSLDVFIARLRKYLSHEPALEIRNYHGVGFGLIVNA